MVNLVAVGVNHRTAPVELRERVAFRASQLGDALRSLRTDTSFGVAEAVILSTCNRVEIYASSVNGAPSGEPLMNFIARQHAVDPYELAQHSYAFTGREAVRHLFEVAAGIDSMVVGETQVGAQVKEAYLHAAALGATGKLFHGLFQTALRVAKRVQCDTAISRGRVSVSSVAAEFARKIFGSLSNRTVMVIGAGETGKLTLRHLQSLGASSVLVTNRTEDRAASLAQKLGGEVVPFDQMADQLHRADIVISSTDAPHCVIHPAQVRAAIERRRNEPMFLIDIAVPRDIDPQVNDIDNVYLYDIDDLQRAVEENSAEREGELQRCRAIIEEEVEAFAAHCAEETAHPTIAELRQAAEEIRRAELDKLLAQLPQLGPEDAAQIGLATQRIVNKLLHGPQETLTQEARAGRAGPVIRLVRRLFGLRGG